MVEARRPLGDRQSGLHRRLCHAYGGQFGKIGRPEPARSGRCLLRRAGGCPMSATFPPIDAEKYGPWAVIAGGSEGIGSALAGYLAEAGINIVLVARKVEPLEDVAADLRARTGVEVRTLSLDLSADDMLDRLRAATDDIDVGFLVYNAGASHVTGEFINWPLEDVEKVVRLNTLGQAMLAHHFGKLMAQRGK